MTTGALLGFPAAGHASMIFDQAPTQIITGGDDVNPVNVSLPVAFELFGTSQSQLRVGSNGAIGVPGGLNGTQYNSSQTPWYNVSSPIIAPLWNDLNTAPTGATFTGGYGGTSAIGVDTYANSYSITYPAAYTYGPGHAFTTEISFQVSLFTGGETVTLGNGDSFTFQSGDLAFSYANNSLVAFTGGSAAVGLAKGDNTTVVGMPGTTNGVLTTANRGNLPTGQSFILFRADGMGSYTASIESFTTVPEPTTLVLLLAGGAMLRGRRRGRLA